VHEKPSFVSYLPDVADAVERAAETGEDYLTAMRQVQKPQRDLAMAVHAADAQGAHQNEYPGVVDPVPMEEYDFLFHPTARRPNTPEYIYGGIHPSLRKK